MDFVKCCDFIHHEEEDLGKSIFTQRSFLFYGAAVKRMEVPFKVRRLPLTGGSFIVLLVDAVLWKIMDQMNRKIKLLEDGTKVVHMIEIYQ